MAEQVVDGEKRINSRETSKRGWPKVDTGTPIDCAHCDGIHEADYRDSDVGLDVPGGHKRHNHFTCPETGKRFAAKAGSRIR